MIKLVKSDGSIFWFNPLQIRAVAMCLTGIRVTVGGSATGIDGQEIYVFPLKGNEGVIHLLNMFSQGLIAVAEKIQNESLPK